MKVKSSLKLMYVLLAILVLSFGSLFAVPSISQQTDQVKEVIFKEAMEALKKAKAEDVSILSPNNFTKANEFYQKALEYYEKGDRLDKIRKNLKLTLEHIETAFKVAKLSRKVLESLIKMKEEAKELEGFVRNNYFSGKLMAEKDFKEEQSYFNSKMRGMFKEATIKIEDSNMKSARSIATKAEKKYRRWVIDVLKKVVLADARKKLKNVEGTIPNESFRKAEDKLDVIENSIKSQKKKDFALGEMFIETQNHIIQALDVAIAGSSTVENVTDAINELIDELERIEWAEEPKEAEKEPEGVTKDLKGAPDFDARAYERLIEEARNLIPKYAPEWTDNNINNSEISKIQLIACMTGLMIYRLNQDPNKISSVAPLTTQKLMEYLSIVSRSLSETLTKEIPGRLSLDAALAKPTSNSESLLKKFKINVVRTESYEPSLKDFDLESIISTIHYVLPGSRVIQLVDKDDNVVGFRIFREEETQCEEELVDSRKKYDECRAKISEMKRKGKNQTKTIDKILSHALPEKKQREAFMNFLCNFDGEYEKYWKKYLPNDAVLRDKSELISGILFNYQLVLISGDYQPLVEELQVKRKLTSSHQLLELSTDEWEKILKKTGVPEYINGKNDWEKKEHYAELLQNTINAAFPTQVVARMVKNRELPIKDANVREGIIAFLSRNEKFDIASSRIHEFEKEIKVVSPKNFENVINNLVAIQRVFKLSPAFETTSMLLESGFSSAHDIASVPKKDFIKMYGSKLGGKHYACAVHQKARLVCIGAISSFMRWMQNLPTSKSQ